MSKCSCFVEKIIVLCITFLVRTFCYCNSDQWQYS